ncbi:MAG: PH domain-containing protein [Actinomycetota bacterium]
MAPSPDDPDLDESPAGPPVEPPAIPSREEPSTDVGPAEAVTDPAPHAAPTATPEELGESSAESADGDDPESLDWRRPHPFTIVFEFGNALRSLLFPLALVGLGGDFFSFESFTQPDFGLSVELVVVFAPVVAAIARWYTTRYALGAESIHHRYGLLRRRKQVLPRANVQNVSTKAGLIARIGSMVELQISDASATGDIKIRLVTVGEAERLTALLRSDGLGYDDLLPADASGVDTGWLTAEGGVPGGGSVDTDAGTRAAVPGAGAGGTLVDGASPIGGAAPVGPPVTRAADVEPSLGDLARAELLSIKTVTGVLGVLIAPIIVFALGRRFDLEVVERWPWVVLLPPLGLIVLTATDLVFRLLTFGGYQLRVEPDRLRIQAGLITEAKITTRRERIQQIEVQRDLVQRRYDIERVRYETADIDLQGTAATSFLDPAATTDEWLRLTELAIGPTALRETDLRPVSRLTVRRATIRAIPNVVITSALSGVLSLWLVPVVAVVATVIAWRYAVARYRALGWTMDDEHYLVRSGVLLNTLHLVRLDKVQAVRTRATFFQRRLELADVRVSTAGVGVVGLVTIPDLPLAEAEELLAALAHRSARTPLADTL